MLKRLGLAQCYHHLQKESLKMTFDGRAVSQAQQVVNHLARFETICLSLSPT